MAVSKVSKKDFVTQWGAAPIEQLRAAAKEMGHSLRASTREEAVEEAYALYAGKIEANAAPAAPAAPAHINPTELAYEARVVGHDGRAGYRRAGYVHQRVFTRLDPCPTAEQLAELHADPRIAVRIAE